jgi:two-component system KDP operon response regulator KdpE
MRPDLVVLDISMPKMSGYEVCKCIRETSQVPILMLTVRDDTLDKVQGFELGADDYLTKPFDDLELLARLRALVRRSNLALLPQDDFVSEELSINFATHEVRVQGESVRLTPTEYKLLTELARRRGAVLTHKYLLQQVWGPQYENEVNYLKVFMQRLRQKLRDDADNPRYIQTIRGIGYRFGPQ